MSKSLFLALFLFTICNTTSAAIFKSQNNKLGCTEYSVVNKVKTENGDYVYQRELKSNEEIITDKTIYGLSLKNMEIDFDKRTASFDIIKNVTLGLNRSLLSLGSKITIDSRHKDFQKVNNMLNRKLILITNICLDENLNIISISQE